MSVFSQALAELVLSLDLFLAKLQHLDLTKLPFALEPLPKLSVELLCFFELESMKLDPAFELQLEGFELCQRDPLDPLELLDETALDSQDLRL